jgi:predicted peroxiredoxin
MRKKKGMAWQLGLLLIALLAAPAAVADEDKTFFYNVTTDETWSAGMALGQGLRALEAGYEVVYLLNVRGVYLASKEHQQDIFGPSGKTPREMLQLAADKGARIVICPMCMRKAGLEMGDLLAAAEKGGPSLTFKLMAAEDTVVMSY